MLCKKITYIYWSESIFATSKKIIHYFMLGYMEFKKNNGDEYLLTDNFRLSLVGKNWLYINYKSKHLNVKHEQKIKALNASFLAHSNFVADNKKKNIRKLTYSKHKNKSKIIWYYTSLLCCNYKNIGKYHESHSITW